MSEQRNDTNNASSTASSPSPRRTLSRSASARQLNRYNPLSRSTRPTRTSSTQSLPLNASSLLSPNEEDPPPPSGMVTRSRAAALAAGGQQRRRDVDNVPYSLRRSVRMSRMREQQQQEDSSSMMDIDQPQQQQQPDASANNDPAHTLLAPSMIADVITQAVLSAFRDRHTGGGGGGAEQQQGHTTETITNHPDPMMTTTAAAAAAAATATTTTTGEGGAEQSLSSLASMHIPSMMSNQQQPSNSSSPSTGASTDESFFRYVRLPVMLTTVSANGETQQLREMTMPMVIVGYRIRGTAAATGGGTTSATTTPNEGDDEGGGQQGLRRSQRIAAQREQQRQQQEEEEQQRNASSRWMVWIYSDTTGEGGGTLPGLSESPTYEELLSLVESLGPARFPISIEQIDASAPTQQYNAQVAASMVGDTEQCHVCLEKFVALDVVRVLKCQHGFHQTCIDKWLTEGQNRCPLCRAVPVERTPNNTTSTTNTTTTTPSTEASQ